MNLLTDTQLSDQCTVTLDVLLHQVVEHLAALTYHLQQATTRVVILGMNLQVLGQLRDASGQDRNLYLGRTGVSCMGAVCLDNGSLVSLRIMVFTS